MAPDVLEFRPREFTDEDRTLHTRSRTRGCLHRRYELDGQAQKVYCHECGAEVTAFDALEDLSRRVERYIFERQNTERKAKQAERGLQEAERLLRNAKARVRRAVGRAPACNCPEEFKAMWQRSARFDWPWCPKCGGRR